MKALSFLNQLRSTGIDPDEFIFSVVLPVCADPFHAEEIDGLIDMDEVSRGRFWGRCVWSVCTRSVLIWCVRRRCSVNCPSEPCLLKFYDSICLIEDMCLTGGVQLILFGPYCEVYSYDVFTPSFSVKTHIPRSTLLHTFSTA
ncbi:hypothetical protein Dimus_012023 [Dionaea muscipula]